MENSILRTLKNFSLMERQIPIYRTVVVCEKTSLRHFDEGRFFISQISPKGKREKNSLFPMEIVAFATPSIHFPVL